MKYWTVERKIISCFAAIFIMVAMLSWVSVHGFSSMNHDFGIAVNSTARKIRLSGDINMAVSDMLVADRGVLLYTREKNDAGVEAAKHLFADRVALIAKDVTELKPLGSSNEEGHAIEVVVRGSAEWQNIFEQIVRLCAAGDVGAAGHLEALKAMPVYHELDDITDQLQEMQSSKLQNDKERASRTFRSNRVVSFGLLAMSFLVSVIAFIAVRRISSTLLESNQAAEAEAKRRQFKLSLIRAIHKVSLDGILVVDNAGRVVSSNKTFLDVWQLPDTIVPDFLPDAVRAVPDQVVLSEVLDRVSEPEAFLKRVQELYGDPHASDHCEIELKDGRTLERYSTSLRGEKDEHLGRVWFFRDISTRMQNERALQGSEAKFRQLAENIREVFWMMPPTTDQMLYISPAYEQVWGRSCDSLYHNPMSWTEAIHPDDLEQAHALFGRQIKGELVESEYRIRTPDGQEKWIRDRAFPIHDEAGQLIRIVGVAEEITEKRRYEAELATTNRALNQAQKMEAVGRLAGGIAHDFNNLLMVIQSYTEMLQDSLPDRDPLRKNTEQILKAAHRASSLTGQMLAFSRKQITAPVVLDLNAVIDETAKMLRRLIGEDIELRVDLAESLWAIKADTDQIGQILMNLCINSRDAMPQGGVITIATEDKTVVEGEIDDHPYVAPGEYVKLLVTDTGTGISKEQQEKIFEPFFTTKEVGKGTGLGLAMVYGIVKHSGGYVWFDSEIGRGTCFTICLPRAKGMAATAMAAKTETQPRGTGTILLAEDEEALRGAICAYLRNLGYTVLAAGSGQQALAVASEHEGRIDLLITDVVMPKMGGRELSQMLGSLRPDLKTIHMSGYTDDAVLRHGIQDMGARFLQKPFNLSTLARTVSDTLGRTETVQ